jgi:hypothetical protein
VVVANATRPVLAVQESMSDKDEPTQDVVDPIELVNSLDEVTSPPARSKATQPQATDFKDSIHIEYSSAPAESSEDSGISMSMSDRDQPSTATKGKAPQLVNTKQSTSLRTASTVSRAVASSSSDELASQDTSASQVVMAVDSLLQLDRPPQRLQPSGGLATLPMPAPTQTPLVVSASRSEPRAVESQQDFSSRRENKPEEMKIHGEVEPATEYTPPRQLLVPLLANATGRAKVTERVSSEPLSQSTAPAQPAASVKPTAPSTEVASKDLSVMVGDSVSLQTAETVQAVSVEHEGFCQVIQTGGKAYSVIGIKPGATRVAVITESAGQRKVQIQYVKVEAAQATRQDSSSIASDISQTIQQLYPRSKVRISTRGSQFVVSGLVDSENTAKKILSLVRKTTLTSVVDELKIK